MSWIITFLKRILGVSDQAGSGKKRKKKKIDPLLEQQQVAALFQERFHITFDNPQFIIRALKHRSFLSQTNESRMHSNERLEFLGDAVLDLVMTHYLFESYPQKTEGQLSKMKSILVSKPVMADIAVEMNLGDLMLLNRGEEKTGGRQRKSILADAFEAIIGAIYLDKGYEDASAFIHQYLIKDAPEILEKSHYHNYKSELLEYAQGLGNGLPVYKIVAEDGPDHAKVFEIEVWLSGEKLGMGRGKSKKIAEQEAAKVAVTHLGVGE